MRARSNVLNLHVSGTLVLLVMSSVQAANNRIEPDDHAEGAVLNDVHPLVDLRIYDGVLRTNFPTDFGVFPDPAVSPVTANENPDIFGGYFTSTGTKTFGHADITFFPESRQLAMLFLSADESGHDRLHWYQLAGVGDRRPAGLHAHKVHCSTLLRLLRSSLIRLPHLASRARSATSFMHALFQVPQRTHLARSIICDMSQV